MNKNKLRKFMAMNTGECTLWAVFEHPIRPLYFMLNLNLRDKMDE